MGGSGSGRRWNSKETTSNYYQLDIRRWQRKGLLTDFQRFKCLCWNVDVLPAPNLHSKPDRVILSRLDSSDWKRPVWLDWTACSYGGSRAWFLCPVPTCGRRVAILYYGRDVACRRCRNLSYDCQQESTKHRTLHAAAAIRMKLGGSGSLAEPFPPKPKRMHWRTYRRLYTRAEQHEAIFFGGLAVSLGQLQSLCQRLERG